ncbi:DUF3429 domain-containing protein [Erythrobacter sp. THAF29]|uniref:DUF3429 domain-containing protein n=1 Tax=Erythrobacter sp. THAF29 TaxID=2587851 RepID=UPI0012680C43|nr:DUF3429 domain-containing protein [Erythrobacter sp. THAF29]QFT77703.1 hypothetical protein FIU90_09155 [Erythrobacter sp. THAF29]
MDGNSDLTRAARWLGYAGLLPQFACLAFALSGHEWRFVALAGGFAYAAAIFSFLGGVWWGQALASGRGGAGPYLVAVMPSLIAAVLFLPWSFGWDWPGPALMYLGTFILISPLVDRALGYASRGFVRLRIQLSVGLGVLTVMLGIAAQAIV